MFWLSFLSGVIFLIVGLIMYNFPPKEINWLYGYRTTASMKSKERWDFAQKYSTIKMLQAAGFIILFSFTGFLFPDSVPGRLFGSFILLIGAVCYMLITTEKELKRRFKD